MILSPWTIVIEFSILLLGLFWAGKKYCNDYIRGFFVIALTIDVVYLWIALFDPSIQSARGTVRSVLLLNGGGSLYLLWRYLRGFHG